MHFPENGIVFPHDVAVADVETARTAGIPFVVLPRPRRYGTPPETRAARRRVAERVLATLLEEALVELEASKAMGR